MSLRQRSSQSLISCRQGWLSPQSQLCTLKRLSVLLLSDRGTQNELGTSRGWQPLISPYGIAGLGDFDHGRLPQHREASV